MLFFKSSTTTITNQTTHISPKPPPVQSYLRLCSLKINFLPNFRFNQYVHNLPRYQAFSKNRVPADGWNLSIGGFDTWVFNAVQNLKCRCPQQKSLQRSLWHRAPVGQKPDLSFSNIGRFRSFCSRRQACTLPAKVTRPHTSLKQNYLHSLSIHKKNLHCT